MDKDLLIKLQKDLNTYMVDHVDIGVKRSRIFNGESATRNNEVGEIDDKFMENLNTFRKESQGKPPITSEQLSNAGTLSDIARDVKVTVWADTSFMENLQKLPEQTDKLVSLIKDSTVGDIIKNAAFNTVGTMYINGGPYEPQLKTVTEVVGRYFEEYGKFNDTLKISKEIEKEFQANDPIGKELAALNEAIAKGQATVENAPKGEEKKKELEKLEDLVMQHYPLKEEKYDPAFHEFRDKKFKELGLDPNTIVTTYPNLKDIYNELTAKAIKEREEKEAKQAEQKQEQPAAEQKENQVLPRNKAEDKSAARSPEMDEMIKAASGLAMHDSVAKPASRADIGNLSETSYGAGMKKESNLTIA